MIFGQSFQFQFSPNSYWADDSGQPWELFDWVGGTDMEKCLKAEQENTIIVLLLSKHEKNLTTVPVAPW